jgi:hypothetical protein
MIKTLNGISIQYPYAQLILAGKKTIETRTYPIPNHYVGVPLLLVETPGKQGRFKSRGIAIITFSGCFKYRTAKEFYGQSHLHLVDKSSEWSWKPGKEKWGWEVKEISRLKTPILITKRLGIKFTKNIELGTSGSSPESRLEVDTLDSSVN